MTRYSIDEIVLYRFNNLTEHTNTLHYVSTRYGGTSKGQWASLNVGFGVDDDYDVVLSNRNILANSLSLSLDNFVFANQVHGTTVACVTSNMKGMGAVSKEDALFRTDALVTNEPNLCLNVMGADCTPILLYDPVQKAVAAIHSGWRGTVQCIATKTIETMVQLYGTKPRDIIAGIGPSIGPCCYTIGSDVIDAVRSSYGSTDQFIRYSNIHTQEIFDIWYANKYLLLQAGVQNKNIEVAELCTSCNSEIFFSSRKHNGNTGRFAAGIGIRSS